MVDTAFDRAERGLGSTDLSVADIVAKTRGNPNEIMKLVMGGQINLTQGLLAKRLSDSVVAEQQKAAAPTTTVLQDSFPQLAPPPAMGGLQPPAAPMAPAAPQGMGPVAPQMQAPQGMAEGGLAQLDFAAPDYAGGGIVAFDDGGTVTSPEEFGAYLEELASGAVPGINVTSRTRTAARNRAVGGVSNSFHLIGAARDFVPPRGMSMADLHSTLRDTLGSNYDIINEGDHVHVEPSDAVAGAVRGGSQVNPSSGSNISATDRGAFMDFINERLTPSSADPTSYLEQLQRLAPTNTEAMERLQARLEAEPDPERARERAELGALFQSIGNVRPGMNPLEALAQGFATSGASMQAAEDRATTQELERLQTAAELERVQNQMTREEYQIAVQLAQYDAGRLDESVGRQIEAALAIMGIDSQERIENARILLGRYQTDTQAETARRERGIFRLLQGLGGAGAGAQGGSLEESLNLSRGGGGAASEAPAGWGQATVVNP